jgi:hypothetical protein
MAVSSAEAAGVLRQHGCSAATDVTGFGLLGHAVEMARAPHVRVWLWSLHGDMAVWVCLALLEQPSMQRPARWNGRTGMHDMRIPGRI